MTLRDELRNSLCSALGEIEALYLADAAVEQLRAAASQEDADGKPLWPETSTPADAAAVSDTEQNEPIRGVRFPHQQT